MVFIYRHTVAFHETDAAGLVHFSNYFRWMEITEHAFLKSQQIDLFEVDATGSLRGWPRGFASAHFHSPLVYGDAIECHLSIAAVRSCAVTYDMNIFKCSGTERIRAASTAMTSIYAQKNISTQTFAAVLLPEDWVHKLQACIHQPSHNGS